MGMGSDIDSMQNTAASGVNSSEHVAESKTISRGSDHKVNTPPTRTVAGPRAVKQQDGSHDIDTRDPKRRRTSSPRQNENLGQDRDQDFAAAAARALAISLGTAQQADQKFNGSSADQVRSRDGSATTSDAKAAIPPPQPVPTPPVAMAGSTPPTRQMRLNNLQSLHDCAMQLLRFLAKLNHLEIGAMLFGPPSARRDEYQKIKSRFERVKSIYMTGSPFIIPDAVGLREQHQVETLRTANIASMITGIFSGEIGMRVMDMSFVDVFVPDGGRLLKAQGTIYLELKTQAFMAAARTAPGMLDQVMLDLFPSNIDKQLVRKRPGTDTLTSSEEDFLSRLKSRQNTLYDDMKKNRLGSLGERYTWNEFSRQVSSYLTQYIENTIAFRQDHASPQSPGTGILPSQQDLLEAAFSLDDADSAVVETSPLPPLPTQEDANDGFTFEKFIAAASHAAKIAAGDPPGSISGTQDRSLNLQSIGQGPTPPT